MINCKSWDIAVVNYSFDHSQTYFSLPLANLEPDPVEPDVPLPPIPDPYPEPEPAPQPIDPPQPPAQPTPPAAPPAPVAF